MRKQRTFISKYDDVCRQAINWLNNLSEVFSIKKVKIDRLKDKRERFYIYKRVRVIVEFE